MQAESQNPEVKGLIYIPNIITLQQEQQLIEQIKKQPWNTSLKRRTQHYGYQYSYDRKSKATKTTEIPEWCTKIKERIQKSVQGWHNKVESSSYSLNHVKFDQIIVNEYEPGQGINPHIDNIKLFQDCVVSLSLGSDSVMVFEKQETKVQVGLKSKSLVCLIGDARFKWKHSIPSRKTDHGKVRGVRYSLTFRTMKEIQE